MTTLGSGDLRHLYFILRGKLETDAGRFWRMRPRLRWHPFAFFILQNSGLTMWISNPYVLLVVNPL
jgi:hypothetical protein